jgi:hypothetical protein
MGPPRSRTSPSAPTTSRPTTPPGRWSYGGAAGAGSPRGPTARSAPSSPRTASPAPSRPTRPPPSAAGARRVVPCSRASPTRPPPRTSPRGGGHPRLRRARLRRRALLGLGRLRRRAAAGPLRLRPRRRRLPRVRALPARPHRGLLDPRGTHHHHPVRAGPRDLLRLPRRRRQLHLWRRVQRLQRVLLVHGRRGRAGAAPEDSPGRLRQRRQLLPRVRLHVAVTEVLRRLRRDLRRPLRRFATTAYSRTPFSVAVVE